MSESPAGASGGRWEEPVLVACRWFDRELAGYIAGEDLEEIAFMVSDGMSSQSACPSLAVLLDRLPHIH